MEELPEEVRRMIVGMACSRSADPRIYTDKDADEARSKGVGEVVDKMGVFAWRSIAR